MIIPYFSVVTISFNQARFLERTINSVLNQRAAGIEYTVIDAGSTDGSREIIERYRPDIDKIIMEEDKGPPDGLNKGLANSTGKFFIYINSDDIILDGALMHARHILESDNEIDVLYAHGHFLDENDAKLRPAFSSRSFSASGYALGRDVVVQQASIIRTELLRSLGGFPVSNRTSWDGEVLLNAAMDGAKFRRVWAYWGGFRIHGASITGSGRLNEAYAEDQRSTFRRVFGRERTRSDDVGAAVAWLYGLLRDPRRVMATLFYRVAGR